MLNDEQLIAEIRDALVTETRGIEPSPRLLERVHSELETSGRGLRERQRASRTWLNRLGVGAAVAVALAIAAVVLVVVHSHRAPGTNVAAPPPVGTVQIASRTADPHGGPPWALRTAQTGQRRACLQIGRLRSGQIGSLGQDGAYGNDGRFHPIPVTANEHCATTDADGYLFLNVLEQDVPASAPTGSVSGCRVGRGVPTLPKCPRADLRDVAYGALGPQAVSITYTIDHRTMTTRTGPDGAYIVVLPGSSEICTTDAHGGRSCDEGAGETSTSTLASGVITAVTYRDGHICHLSASSATEANCPNVGYAKYPPQPHRHITPAQVRSTVTPSFAITNRVCYRPKKGVNIPFDIPCQARIPTGYKVGYTQPTLLIDMRFIARLAADNHHSVYEWSLGRVSGPDCRAGGLGGGVAATTMTPIRAGQHVALQDNESPCPGTYKGVVTYQPDGAPGHDTLIWDAPIHDHSILVGRFSFVVPKPK